MAVPDNRMLARIGISVCKVAIVPIVSTVFPFLSCKTTDVPADKLAVASQPSVFVCAETVLNTSVFVSVEINPFEAAIHPAIAPLIGIVVYMLVAVGVPELFVKTSVKDDQFAMFNASPDVFV